MSHIFISYSRKDSEYSNALVEKLRSEGFDVWCDRDIAPGAGWSDIIEEKIDTCAAFLLIMTANSKKSTPVKIKRPPAKAGGIDGE
jgi:hypothetical protein